MKRKLIACLAAGMALCTAVALFAGCSDGNPEKQPDDGDTPGGTTEATVEWQFTGTYHDLMKNGFDFYFDADTNSIIANYVVPEPATAAAILGVFALAFAAYKRRK